MILSSLLVSCENTKVQHRIQQPCPRHLRSTRPPPGPVGSGRLRNWLWNRYEGIQGFGVALWPWRSPWSHWIHVLSIYLTLCHWPNCHVAGIYLFIFWISCWIKYLLIIQVIPSKNYRPVHFLGIKLTHNFLPVPKKKKVDSKLCNPPLRHHHHE